MVKRNATSTVGSQTSPLLGAEAPRSPGSDEDDDLGKLLSRHVSKRDDDLQSSLSADRAEDDYSTRSNTVSHDDPEVFSKPVHSEADRVDFDFAAGGDLHAEEEQPEEVKEVEEEKTECTARTTRDAPAPAPARDAPAPRRRVEPRSAGSDPFSPAHRRERLPTETASCTEPTLVLQDDEEDPPSKITPPAAPQIARHSVTDRPGALEPEEADPPAGEASPPAGTAWHSNQVLLPLTAVPTDLSVLRFPCSQETKGSAVHSTRSSERRRFRPLRCGNLYKMIRSLLSLIV